MSWQACTSFRSAPGQELRDACHRNEFLGLILISVMVGWIPKYSVRLPSRSDAILTFPSSDLLAACKTRLKGTSCTPKQDDSIKNKYIQKQEEKQVDWAPSCGKALPSCLQARSQQNEFYYWQDFDEIKLTAAPYI